MASGGPNTYGSWKQPITWGRGIRAPFPDIWETRFAWHSDAWSKFTMGASESNVHVSLRPNSIYDPDWAWGGQSVRGWDNFQSVYSYYFVKKVYWKFTVITEGLVQDQLNYMFYYPRANGTVMPGKFVGYSRMKQIMPYVRTRQLNRTGNDLTYMASMFGTWVPNFKWPATNPYEDAANWGTILPWSNPSAVDLMHFGVIRDRSDTDSPAALDYRFKVEMYMDVVLSRNNAIWSTADDGDMIPAEVYDLTAGYGEADDDGTPDNPAPSVNATGDVTDMPAWYVDDP